MMDLSEARQLEDQLFPDREAHDSRDFYQAACGMVIVALHSALEHFAKSLRVTKRGTSLPNSLRDYMEKKASLHWSLKLADELSEFHEIRILIVHDSGIISERFARKVPHSVLQRGEVFPISANALPKYANLVWTVAAILRSTTSPAT